MIRAILAFFARLFHRVPPPKPPIITPPPVVTPPIPAPPHRKRRFYMEWGPRR